MVEQALMASMAALDVPVPASIVQWVVTGSWPRPSLRFDVS